MTNVNTIPVEFSRKDLIEIKNNLPPNSKALQKIIEAISLYEPNEDDEEFLEDEEGRFGKFNLNSND